MILSEFNKDVKCGNEYLAVRIIENCEDLKVGNIYLSNHAEANSRLAFCQIIDIGVTAAEKSGCHIGDYVMIDRLATFGHTSPHACLKYDSLICLTNETNTDYFPLKDTMFVEPDDKDEITQVNNVFLVNYSDKLRLGTIVKMNFDKTNEYPFEVGQHVMLSKGADVVKMKNTEIRIYKKEMIVCVVK